MQALSHFFLLNSVLDRIAYHGFKLAPKKLSLFQSSAKVLGHILTNEGLSVDPDRITKMVNAPMPENRTQMQKFLGFLSSVKYFSPPELSEQHAILAPLTSALVDFKMSEEHKKAFHRSKEILTSTPFYLDFPEYDACKVLFTDASDILLSGILMDIYFPSLVTENIEVNTKNSQIKLNVHQHDKLSSCPNLLHNYKLMPIPFQSKPLSSFFEAICCLIEIAEMHNVPTNHKYLRNCVLAHIDNSVLKQEFFSFLKRGGTSWHLFFEKYHQSNAGIDPEQLLIAATARYLDREIVVVQKAKGNELLFRVHKASTRARSKPVFWVFLEKEGREEYFQPLMQYSKNSWSGYSNYSKVKYDLPFMQKEEIAATMKSFMANPKKSACPMSCKVVGYFSQVIPSIDRSKAIWLKESQALINSLYKFKSLIELSPVVVSFCDSSVVYLLCQRAITESCLKIRRTAAMLKLEYPNLVVTGLPGKDNISDYLSRIMTLPSVVLNSIQSKQIDIGRCSELDFKPFSLPEAEVYVEQMPVKHRILDKAKWVKEEEQEGKDKIYELHDKQASILLAVDDSIDARADEADSKLSLAEKTLLDTIKPIQILGKRFEKCELLSAQLKWISEVENNDGPDKMIRDENFCINAKTGLYNFNGKIFIPPSLEGVILSYYHLISGHVGQKKLYMLLRSKYFFEKMEEKCRIFCTTCHACAIVNPDRKVKTESGSVPLPSSTWETISLDFLEVSKNPSGIKAILVITDHFSKAIFTFLMKSTAAAPVLDRLRDFLMFTGCATRYVLTDNGSPFSGADFNKFLFVMGIYKIKSTPYLSRARGQVESCNRIITVLLRKMLLLSPRYNFKDVLFLAPVLYNSGVNHQTKTSPFEIIFGRVPLHHGPLSGKIREPPKHFSEVVRGELLQLRKAISERVATTRDLLKANQDRYLQRINKKRKPLPQIYVGDICFIKNHSTADVGERSKLRPRLIKSPFIVITSKVRSVIVMRLADGYVTSRHPDDLLVYNEKSKDSALFQDLDPEVWAILGQKLDKDKLEELARKDELPLIYTDVIVEKPVGPTTRSLSSQQKKLENAYLESYSDDDISDSVPLDNPPAAPKKVRFDLPGFEENSDQTDLG